MMFGCLRTVGCLTMVGVVGAGAWFGRDLWWERATGRPSGAALSWSAPTDDPQVLERRLRQAQSSAFVSLSPGELARLLEQSVGQVLRDPGVAIQGDVVHVRGRVSLSKVPDAASLGPLSRLLTGEPVVEVAGRPAIIERGSARILVTEVRVGGVEVPGPVREAVLRQLRGGDSVPDGIPHAIRFSVPSWAGDLRVGNGTLTVYRDKP